MRKRIVLASCVLAAFVVTFTVWRERTRSSRVLPREHGLELRFMLSGASPDDEFGGVVEILADGNGDGRPDLAVGAPYDDAAGENAGRVAIFDHEGRAIADLRGTRHGGCFGSSVRRIGDVDHDGTDDFVVGASGQGASLPGRVVVFSGATRERLFAADDDRPSGRFGHCVVGLGDVDGDGTCDLAVGAPGSHRRDVRGRVLVLSGRDGGVMREFEEAGRARFGFALARTADRDGDGVDDLAVASRWAPLRIASPATGEFIALGREITAHDLAWLPAHETTPPRLVVGTFVQDDVGAVAVFALDGGASAGAAPATTSFGHTVAVVGDVDGDGTPDVAVGAPDDGLAGILGTRFRGCAGTGSVSVFTAGSTLREIFTYRGEREGDNLGYDICGADLDGDGFAEIVLGTTVDDGTPGHVRVISFRREIVDGNGRLTSFRAPADMGPGE